LFSCFLFFVSIFFFLLSPSHESNFFVCQTRRASCCRCTICRRCSENSFSQLRTEIKEGVMGEGGLKHTPIGKVELSKPTLSADQVCSSRQCKLLICDCYATRVGDKFSNIFCLLNFLLFVCL